MMFQESSTTVDGLAWLNNISYKVGRVIDGDTFETAEHQVIRLAYTNAPEAVPYRLKTIVINLYNY